VPVDIYTYFSFARSFIPSSNAGVTFSLSQRRVGAPAPLVSVPAALLLLLPLPLFVVVVLAGVGAAGGVVAPGVMASGVGVESVAACCCWGSMVLWGIEIGSWLGWWVVLRGSWGGGSILLLLFFFFFCILKLNGFLEAVGYWRLTVYFFYYFFVDQIFNKKRLVGHLTGSKWEKKNTDRKPNLPVISKYCCVLLKEIKINRNKTLAV
jgi:hypothetical protein